MDEGIVRIFHNRDLEVLHTHCIGKTVYKYDTVSSTNDVALRYARAEEKEGAVFWARAQTRGRGRFSRTWVSLKDAGLYFSVLLRPEILVRDASLVTLMAAVSMVRALRQFTGIECLIKWPNDLVVNDKKIGGILTEMDSDKQRVKCLVMGIGINTNLKVSELPVREATSLKIILRKEISSESLLGVCLKHIDKEYFSFKKQGVSSIIEEARQFSSLWGRQVEVTTLGDPGGHKLQSKHTLVGVAVDFDEQGALVIREETGFLKKIYAGDVKLLRPSCS